MPDPRGTCGGGNVELVSKAQSLDLTRPNTTVTLRLTLPQAEMLLKVIGRGVKRLRDDQQAPRGAKTGKLRMNVKLGTKQKRIFVPGVE